jgi:hypothetical protein
VSDEAPVPIHQDVHWSQVPEWIVFHVELSGQDVRVFAALQCRSESCRKRRYEETLRDAISRGLVDP